MPKVNGIGMEYLALRDEMDELKERLESSGAALTDEMIKQELREIMVVKADNAERIGNIIKPSKTVTDHACFAIFKDRDVRAVVTGDPLQIPWIPRHAP